MTAAQKTAKTKFKQAIAYRQKTGVSLKEAFAHIYGKKTDAVNKKAVKKVGAVDTDKAFKKQMQVNKIINTKFKNWEFPVPPVYTGNWSAITWSNWIKKNGRKIGAIKNKIVKKKSAPKKVVKKKLTQRDYDKRFQADKPGKRTSASGNTYYESRPNRSDKGKLLGIGQLTKIIGKVYNKYYVEFIHPNEYKSREYFNVLPKNYYKGKDRILYISKLTNKGTALIPLKYTKNDKFIKK